MKNIKVIMTRAWEIYRTLVGDHMAKLSQALRTAWRETQVADIPVKVEFNLPELKGSQKQIAWAEEIRKTFVKNWTEYLVSDDIFYKGDPRCNNVFVHAQNFFKCGITKWSEYRGETRLNALYKEADTKKDMTREEREEWVREQMPIVKRRSFSETLRKKYVVSQKKLASRKPGDIEDPERTAPSGLDDAKEMLRQCLDYALSKETEAGDWIDKYKYCKGLYIY